MPSTGVLLLSTARAVRCACETGYQQGQEVSPTMTRCWPKSSPRAIPVSRPLTRCCSCKPSHWCANQRRIVASCAARYRFLRGDIDTGMVARILHRHEFLPSEKRRDAIFSGREQERRRWQTRRRKRSHRQCVECGRVGDSVAEGEVIMILESMKMEIPVEPGGHVDTGLVEPEEQVEEDRSGRRYRKLTRIQNSDKIKRRVQ